MQIGLFIFIFILLFAFIISIQGGWKTWVCNCHADRKIGLKNSGQKKKKNQNISSQECSQHGCTSLVCDSVYKVLLLLLNLPLFVTH